MSGDARTHGLRATLLTFVLVALAAATGWTLAPSTAVTARTGSHVAGSAAQQVGQIASRTTRGPVAGQLAQATQPVAYGQRTLSSVLSGANGFHGSHGGSVLVVLGALLALGVAARRLRLLPVTGPALAAGGGTFARGRAPPAWAPAFA